MALRQVSLHIMATTLAISKNCISLVIIIIIIISFLCTFFLFLSLFLPMGHTGPASLLTYFTNC